MPGGVLATSGEVGKASEEACGVLTVSNKIAPAAPKRRARGGKASRARRLENFRQHKAAAPGMGHGVTEYTCRMIFRRVSGLGFVISTLNNAGDRPYPENSGGREIDPSGSWYPSGESPGLSQLPKPSWHLTCQTALSAHPLRAPACARPYTCAMPKPPRAPPGAPPRPVVRASPPSHRAPVGRPG